VCGFIKAQIKALRLVPVKAYIIKSFGSTRPVSSNPAANRRVELTVTN
jgi:flagellar motor protein MotB